MKYPAKRGGTMPGQDNNNDQKIGMKARRVRKLTAARDRIGPDRGAWQAASVMPLPCQSTMPRR
jgi:hypothetical protein